MADSSVAITAGSGTPIRVLTGLGTGSADQQVVTLADSAGNLLGTTGAPVPTSVNGALPAGTNSIGSVDHPALTKGTQGTTGVSTQDLKDAGRTPIVLSVMAVASVTTEALFTLNKWVAGTVTTGTSYTVTSGKTFRIQSIQFGCRFATPSGTVTWANTKINVRAIASGTMGTGSALLYGDSKMAASNVATPNSDLTIPDGLELPSGYILGVSHVDSAATLLLDAVIVGYEY